MEKRNNFVAIILLIIILLLVPAVIISTFLPRIYELYGDGAFWQIMKFILFLVVNITMVFLAYWQLNGINKEEETQEDKDNLEEKKIFVRKIIAKENPVFNNTIKAGFHLLPLYFPFLFMRADLLPEFKVVLFAFSILAYLLVELRYLFKKIGNLASFVQNKLNIQNIILRLSLLLAVIIIFFAAALYAGYNLVVFYINLLS